MAGSIPVRQFCTLLGHLPLPKHTLEGSLQRQLLLHRHKLGVPDPMAFIKEHHPAAFAPGQPAYRITCTLKVELDALVAAYTAWQAATHPDRNHHPR